MASSFSLHLSTPFSTHHLHPLKPKPHSLPLLPKRTTPSSSPRKLVTTYSIKEDTSPPSSSSSPPQPEPESLSPEPDSISSDSTIIDKRRLEEEKFAVLNTGIYECRSCGYKYDEAVGDPSYPIAPGFQFEKLPEDWRCPTCGAARSFFQSKSVEIAGFAQNQQFGLGGNSLTSGQKTVLIYGTLLFFFALFLSGYFLQ
ncbi:hypothetical protein RIF29_24324 [Crotalaria pallida]|uniref:Rubredoxin-like domain-containing protein n=1 Tax=Crotalaria pallida TaxID=3830 RepID=A0AAN9ELS7_CROPI